MSIEDLIVRAENRPLERWADERGTVSWHTLFDASVTPTRDLTAGVAVLQPGEGGREHRHAPAEIYYMLEGTGILTLDGVDRTVGAGDAIFIPGDAWHALRNESRAPLRLLYVFPTSTLAEVEYIYR